PEGDHSNLSLPYFNLARFVPKNPIQNPERGRLRQLCRRRPKESQISCSSKLVRLLTSSPTFLRLSNPPFALRHKYLSRIGFNSRLVLAGQSFRSVMIASFSA